MESSLEEQDWYNQSNLALVYRPILNSLRIKVQSSSRLTQGYLICILGTCIWSLTAIFIRFLTERYDLPPLVLAFWRDLIVFLGLGLVLAVFARRRLFVDRRHLGFLALYGLLLAVFNSLWTASVALNGAAVSTVLAYSSAAFTAVLGWRLFGESLNGTKILAVCLSLLGCVFVSGAYTAEAWRLNPLGTITGLVSGLAFAGYSLMGKSSAERQIYPWSALLYSFGFAALFLLCFNLLQGLLPGQSRADLFYLGNAWVGWLVLIVLAVGPTIGGYGLYTVSLTYLPASVANLIATMEPAMTAILAYILLDERLTLAQLLGSGLILLGVIVLRLSEGRSSEKKPLTTNDTKITKDKVLLTTNDTKYTKEI
jgi:drug/metabolite transporter (DMT)-like permease